MQIHTRGELKCFMMADGEQCAQITGELKKPWLCVDSQTLDTPVKLPLETISVLQISESLCPV